MDVIAILSTMKRYRFWMLGAFVVVTAALIGATIKARQNPFWILSHYPRTPAFDQFIFDISSEMENPISGVGSIMLSIREPVEGDFKTVLEYRVSPSIGFDLNTLNYSKGSGGHGRTSSVSKQQGIEIQKLVHQLPLSAPPDKRENLLVILIYEPSPTQLRLYDSRNSPPQIGQITRILAQTVNKENRSLLPGQPPMPDLPHLRSPLLGKASNSQRAVN